MIAQCIHSFSSEYGLPASLFLAGLMGGATHCTGMCGPFVLAQTENGLRMQSPSGKLLLPYHFGRMTTYVFIAVLASLLVNAAFVFSGLKTFIAAPMLMLAATMFLASAFPKMSDLFPWVARIQFSAPFSLISRITKGLMGSQNIFKRYLLGVALGFLPCGLLLSAIIAAATVPPFQAGIAMAAFAIGTMPALMGVALGGAGLKKYSPRAYFYVSRAAVLASSIWLFIMAGMLIF